MLPLLTITAGSISISDVGNGCGGIVSDYGVVVVWWCLVIAVIGGAGGNASGNGDGLVLPVMVVVLSHGCT